MPCPMPTIVLLVANLFDLTTLADCRLWLEAMAGRHVSREAIRDCPEPRFRAEPPANPRH